MRKYPDASKVALARIESEADAQDVTELTQLVRNIERKRAVLQVIGGRAMKCRSCAGEHLLVAEGTQLMILNPCATLVQGKCRSARTFCK